MKTDGQSLIASKGMPYPSITTSREIDYKPMRKYKKESLIKYLKTKKIDFKLVIIKGEKTP